MTLSVVTTAAHVINANATTSVTFTPAANSLVGVFCGGDAGDGSTDEALTVASTGHIMTRAARSNGGFGGVMELWTTPITSSASMTVNVTDNKGSKPKVVKVVWWTDSSGGTPGVGATAVDNTLASSLAVTSTAAGSWAWMWAFLTANAGTVAGETLQDHVDTGDGWDGGDAAGLYSLDAKSTASGQTMTLTVNTSGSAIQQFVAEIVPPAAGGTDHPATIAPTVTATFTPAAHRIRAGAITAAAVATLTPTSHQDHGAATTATVTAGLTPTAAHVRPAAAAASAAASLTPTPTHIQTAAATADAIATAVPAATPTHPAAITTDITPALLLSTAGQTQAATTASATATLTPATQHTRTAALTAAVSAALTTALTAIHTAAVSILIRARLIAAPAGTITPPAFEYIAGTPQPGWRTDPPTNGWDTGIPQTGWRTDPPRIS